MKNLLNYLSNQAVNISSIWNDSSIFIALLLLVLVLILYFYAKDVRDLNDQLADDIKSLNELCKEKSKAFEDAVVEITELRLISNARAELISIAKDEINDLTSVNKQLWHNNYTNLERINKLQSQIKHTKYVPLNQGKEAEMWECLTHEYDQFSKGDIYKQDKSLIAKDGLIWLFAHPDHLHPYLVEKNYFKPVLK